MVSDGSVVLISATAEATSSGAEMIIPQPLIRTLQATVVEAAVVEATAGEAAEGTAGEAAEATIRGNDLDSELLRLLP